jgi:ABC-2 type transport system permease protein
MTTLIRISAFVRKEAAEFLRQPRLLFTLVIGPFIVLLVFGAGLRDHDPPLRTLFVAPEDQDLASEVEEFVRGQSDRLIVEGIIPDQGPALRQLREGTIDLIVVFPSEVEETVRSGEQAVIRLYHNQIDPVEGQAVRLYMEAAVSEVNQQVLASAIAEGQEDSEELEERIRQSRQRVADARRAAEQDDDARMELEVALLRADTATLALAAGPAAAMMAMDADNDEDSFPAALSRFQRRMDEIDDADDLVAESDELDEDLATMEGAVTEFRAVEPEIMVAPFQGETVLVGGERVDYSDFYAPAVVIVLLQHLLVTFVALSIVRESSLGTTEIYRVAPLRSGELIVGKHLAHMFIAIVVVAFLLVGLILGLGVPMRGSWASLALVIALMLLASAGIGFCVAALSKTDTQAVQYTMLVLLVTIFFSGFLLALERFVFPFRWVGFAVPATYGIELLRDVMLRGAILQPLQLAVLAMFGVLLSVVGGLAVAQRVFRS